MSELNLLQYCDDGKEYEVVLQDKSIKRGKFSKNYNNTLYPVRFSGTSYSYTECGDSFKGKINSVDIISVKPVITEQPKGTEMQEPTPTEYKILTSATTKAKNQIAEFESILENIKTEAMKLNARDFAKVVKMLKGLIN